MRPARRPSKRHVALHMVSDRTLDSVRPEADSPSAGDMPPPTALGDGVYGEPCPSCGRPALTDTRVIGDKTETSLVCPSCGPITILDLGGFDDDGETEAPRDPESLLDENLENFVRQVSARAANSSEPPNASGAESAPAISVEEAPPLEKSAEEPQPELTLAAIVGEAALYPEPPPSIEPETFAEPAAEVSETVPAVFETARESEGDSENAAPTSEVGEPLRFDDPAVLDVAPMTDPQPEPEAQRIEEEIAAEAVATPAPVAPDPEPPTATAFAPEPEPSAPTVEEIVEETAVIEPAPPVEPEPLRFVTRPTPPVEEAPELRVDDPPLTPAPDEVRVEAGSASDDRFEARSDTPVEEPRMEPSLASAALVAEAVPAIDPVIVAAAASVPVTPRRSLVPILGMLLATSIAAASGYFLRGEVERGETLPVLSASLVASAAQEPVVAAVPAVDPPREPANVAPVEAPASTETAPATETAEPVVVAAIPAAAAPAPPIVAPPVVAPEIAAPALPVTAPPVVAAPVAAPEVAAPAAVVSQPEPVAAPESAAPGAAAAPAEPTVPTGTVGAPPALKPEAPVERMEQAEVASAPRLLPPPVAMQPNPVVRPKYSGPPTRPIDPGIYRPKAPGEAIAPAASRPAEVAAVPQARVYSHTSRSWLREDTGTAGSTGWGKLEEGISQNRVNWLLGRPRWIERTLAFEFWMYEVKTPLGSGVVTFENGVVYSWRLPAGAASAERR